jgi:hypothetical protein
VQRLRLVLVAPWQGCAAIGGDEIQTQFHLPLNAGASHRAAWARLDGGQHRRQRREIDAVAPQTQVLQGATNGFDRDVTAASDYRPVCTLLQIDEFTTELTALQEISTRWRGVAEGLDDDLCLAGRGFGTEAAELVDALVEQHVEATIAHAGFSRHVARAGDHVDKLQRHAGLAHGADRKLARRLNGQQHLSVSRGADGGT